MKNEMSLSASDHAELDEIERKTEQAERLAIFNSLGLKPSYRAVVEFSNKGSVSTQPWKTKEAAEAAALALKAKYSCDPQMAGLSITWHGAELESPAQVEARAGKDQFIMSRMPGRSDA